MNAPHRSEEGNGQGAFPPRDMPSAWKYRRRKKIGGAKADSGRDGGSTGLPSNTIVAVTAVFCLGIVGYYAYVYLSAISSVATMLDSEMGAVLELSWSNDGNMLLASGYTEDSRGVYRVARLWTGPAKKNTSSYAVEGSTLEAAAASQDGQTAAFVWSDSEHGGARRLVIEHIGSGTPATVCNLNCGPVTGLVLSGAGGRAAIISDRVILYDLRRHRAQDSLTIDRVCRDFAVYFFDDESLTAKGACGDTLHIWNLNPTRHTMLPLHGKDGQNQTVFSDNGERFAVLSDDTVTIYDSRRCSPLWSTAAGARQGSPFALDDEGKRLAVRKRDGAVIVMDTQTGSVLSSIRPGGKQDRREGSSSQLLPLLMSRDGKRIAALYPETGEVKLYEAATGAELATHLHNDGFFQTAGFHVAAFAPDGSLVTAGRRIHIWSKF